jgi:drug/metabolite transporter (DMT)-like permease
MASAIPGEWAPDRSEEAPRSGVWLTDVLLVCMALIWGVNYSVVKYATRHVDPLAFNAVRIVIALVVLGAAAATVREHTPPWATVRRLVLLGVLGNGLYQLAWVEGLTRTAVGTAALIFAATPAFTGIVGRLLGVERLSRRGWLGIGLQLLGMAGVVGTAAAGGPGARASLLGPAIILLAALVWALYSNLLRGHAQRVHPVHLTMWTLVGGLLAYAVVAPPAVMRVDPTALPRGVWWAVLYSSVLAMVVAFLFYYRGVRVIGPVKTAMFSNLQPIIALVVAYVAFREVPTSVQLGGAALIMTGLVVSRT